MARIINIETSTEICSVSISENGVCKHLKIHIPEENSLERSSHSKLLAVFIRDLLNENKILVSNIDAVAISGGPGSYTGLRIGTSTAKGFAFASNIPLIATDTMLIVAKMAKKTVMSEFDYIIPMIDAKRMEVYCAVFDKNLEKISPTEAKIIDENSFAEYRDKKVLFCGNGAEKCMEIMNVNNFIFKADIYPSAEYMAEISEGMFNENKFADLVYYEPFYLKDFVATTPRNKIF